jgi:hypothetical protein
MSNAGCWKRRLAALAIAMTLLSSCATGASDVGSLRACPPVVEYSREFQARAADEVALLSENSAIAEMLSDYAVMRDQARVCHH